MSSSLSKPSPPGFEEQNPGHYRNGLLDQTKLSKDHTPVSVRSERDSHSSGHVFTCHDTLKTIKMLSNATDATLEFPRTTEITHLRSVGSESGFPFHEIIGYLVIPNDDNPLPSEAKTRDGTEPARVLVEGSRRVGLAENAKEREEGGAGWIG